MQLRIIHTNDIHGHLENWPLISKYIEENQALASAKGERLLTIDIGDAMDSVHPLVEATYGKIMVDLFNQSRYDVVTVGNNEGLNFSKERLKELYDRAEYEVVITNLLDLDTQQTPTYAKKIIYKNVDDLNIVFIGLTAPYPTYGLNGYQIENPIDSLQDALTQINHDEVDLIILLSHLGIESDRYIANLFPEIQVIFGAHTHHVLIEGEWENQTFLCAAGKHGNYVGNLTMYFDDDKDTWQFEANVITINQLSQRYNEPTKNTEYEQLGVEQLNQRLVAEVPESYNALELSGKQSFIQMALDAITDQTGIENAILTSGLFLSDLPKGIVTENHLHEALPHPMHLAKIQMKGEHLKVMLFEMHDQEEDLRHKLINGLGFRGKIFGEIVSKGFAFNKQTNEWEVNGLRINDDEEYSFVTVDHLWFLPFFPTINDFGQPQLIFPDFLRHVVRNHLEKINPIEGGEQFGK